MFNRNCERPHGASCSGQTGSSSTSSMQQRCRRHIIAPKNRHDSRVAGGRASTWCGLSVSSSLFNKNVLSRLLEDEETRGGFHLCHNANKHVAKV